MMLLILSVRLANAGWMMDNGWVERAGEVDPYNLDGVFTVSGTRFGMLCGFVVLTERRGYFLAGEGEWRRLARLVLGLVGIAILYLGLGAIFPDGKNFVSFALRFVRYTLIGLWVSWVGPITFEWMGLLKFKSPKTAKKSE